MSSVSHIFLSEAACYWLLNHHCYSPAHSLHFYQVACRLTRTTSCCKRSLFVWLVFFWLWCFQFFFLLLSLEFFPDGWQRGFQSCKQISFSSDTCLANWIYKGAGLSFLIPPWKFWEFWWFFFHQFCFGKGNLSLSAKFHGMQQLHSTQNPVWKRTQRRLLADLLLAEELSAVPAMVTPLSEWKTNCAARTAVSPLIFHPVISCRSARLITYRPAEHSASTIPNKNSAVIPAWKKQKHSCNSSDTVMHRHQWLILRVRICSMLNYQHSN